MSAGVRGGRRPGDIGPAPSIPFQIAPTPRGTCTSPTQFNHRIRKVSGGIVTTVAGNGTLGSSGDGGQATSAQLRSPAGVAVVAREASTLPTSSTTASARCRAGSSRRSPARASRASRGTAARRPRPCSTSRSISVSTERGACMSPTMEPARAQDRERDAVGDLDASPSSGQAPLNVRFTGSGRIRTGRSPPLRGISATTRLGSGASVSHLYSSAGTFHVTLTVTDDSGAAASASRDVVVSAAPPASASSEAQAEAEAGSAAAVVDVGVVWAGEGGGVVRGVVHGSEPWTTPRTTFPRSPSRSLPTSTPASAASASAEAGVEGEEAEEEPRLRRCPARRRRRPRIVRDRQRQRGTSPPTRTDGLRSPQTQSCCRRSSRRKEAIDPSGSDPDPVKLTFNGACPDDGDAFKSTVGCLFSTFLTLWLPSSLM